MDANKMKQFVGPGGEVVRAIEWKPQGNGCLDADGNPILLDCIRFTILGPVLDACPSHGVVQEGEWIVFRENNEREVLIDKDFYATYKPYTPPAKKEE
jgi:hypothetical protein